MNDSSSDDTRFDRFRDNSGNWVVPPGTWKFAVPFGLLSGAIAWAIGTASLSAGCAIAVMGGLFGKALAEFWQGGPVRMLQPGAVIGPDKPSLRLAYVLALAALYLLAFYRFGGQ